VDAKQSNKYSELADEYYEHQRHPTSANFRDASRALVEDWLLDIITSEVLKGGERDEGVTICEVGAGDSLIAEVLDKADYSLSSLLITDASSEMLQYSQKWGSKGASLATAPAQNLPLPDASLSLLVSVLGDPYNDADFWKEVCRVLETEGCMIYTTPSFEWASRFRNGTAAPGFQTAEFTLRGGKTASVPSVILPEEDQTSLIASHGLSVTSVQHVRLRDLTSENISPKLKIDGSDLPVVTGYLIRKVQ
jgi:SAM-dependent methyltransferase